MSDDLRRTVGDMEIARIRALAHEKPGDKVIDHRNYLDLPPGSGTSVHTRASRARSRGKILTFFLRIFPFLILLFGCRFEELDRNAARGLPAGAACSSIHMNRWTCVKDSKTYVCIYDKGVTECAPAPARVLDGE